MPRKRTTRIKIASQPSKNIPLAQDLSITDKNEQLKVFLKDYDCKVKNTLQDLEKKKTAIIKFINARFEEQILNLPAVVANMTLKEYAEAGGTEEAVIKLKNTTRRQMLDELSWAGAMKSMKTEESGLSIISEEDSEGNEASTKTFKAKNKSKKGTMLPPTSRATRSKLTTPCNSTTRSVWGQTPLITPKFNPYLPITPENERDIKPGERLMSLAGSPVRQLGKRQPTVCIEDVNKTEFAAGLAHIGIDLTPGRAEKILELVSTKLMKK
ncbi:borealin [Biomphalaria pfeifferi]|uniref:Borealin n=1 Tax=Biomphalaria pfeifferi TaxID=112525 RepID=A0AAD8BQ36_BIOPF|nr:borealin [Biomphalaria pfeifferi]